MRRLAGISGIVLLLCLGCGDRDRRSGGGDVAPPPPSGPALRSVPPRGGGSPSQPQDVGDASETAADVAEAPTPPPPPPPPPPPAVSITSPASGLVLPNPITFEYTVSPGIARVAFYVDGFPMQDRPLLPEGRYAYRFGGVNVLRRVELVGLSADGAEVARDAITILPSAGYMVEPSGFNRYVVRALNDWVMYPKDGRYPYCWRDCPGTVGMIHDASYLGEVRWTGDGHCVCTGHTLEIFLDAYRRWQAEAGVPADTPFGALTRDELRREFYQFWQGYKVTDSASCADALEAAGIGYNIYPEQWTDARPGDFMNISRTNGTGHAVIFIAWITDAEDRIIGLRYYGCNRKGDSHPDPSDPANQKVSGPSFITEKFDGWGGTLIPSYVFIGRVLDPAEL